jgi:SAM-dependent methyltransferase
MKKVIKILYYYITSFFIKGLPVYKQEISSERYLRHYIFPLKVDALPTHAAPGTMEIVLRIAKELQSNQRSTLKLANLGAGKTNIFFSNLGIDVDGYDINPEVKNVFYANLNDNDNISEKNKYDIIVAEEIIEHIENPWLFFRKARWISKDNGILIVTTPNTDSFYSRIKFLTTGRFHWFEVKDEDYHINPIFLWELKLIARKNNFKVLKINGNSQYYFDRNLPNRSNQLASESLIVTFQAV